MTFYDYDKVNKLIRKQAPAADGENAVTRYIYDTMGNLIKEISPNNYQKENDTDELSETMIGTSYTYDSMNRRISTISPKGDIVQVARYDKNGNADKIVDGLHYQGNVNTAKGTVYTYDALGHVLSKVDSLGNETVYAYNVLGNILSQTDSRGNTTKYEYNADGTVAKIIAADGGVVENLYDLLGRKTVVKDQRGYVTTYAYNAFGSLRNEKDPYDNLVEYKYDLNGNKVSQKDKNGSISNIIYDACNRIIEKRLPLYKDGSENVIYAREKYNYDEVGNLTSMIRTGTQDQTSVRTTNYTYYDNNLVHTTTDDLGAKTVKSYDLNGNVIKLERLRGKDAGKNDIYDVEEYVYDDMNRLVQSVKLVDKEDIYGYETLPNSELIIDTQYTGKIRRITGYDYDMLGNKIKETSPSGAITSYTYDDMNRVETISKVVNNKLAKVSYHYDGEGNRTEETNELGYTTSYTYDELNRMKSCTDAKGNTFTYGYDLSGNKISEANAIGSTITYTYDKLNRLETTTDPFGVIISRREYDANGNLVKEYDAKENPQLYSYDLSGRLVSEIY